MPIIQNFSVPRGNDATITVDVTSDVVGETLVGSRVVWCVYGQLHGVPIEGFAPIISKSSDGGDGIIIPDSPADAMQFIVTLAKADTAALLGNYYHEASVTDEISDRVTVTIGVMTVTLTENA